MGHKGLRHFGLLVLLAGSAIFRVDSAVAQAGPRINFQEIKLSSQGTMRGLVTVARGRLANFSGCTLRGSIRVAKNNGAPYTAASGEGIDTFASPRSMRFRFRRADLEKRKVKFYFAARGLAGYSGGDPFAVNFLFEMVRCGGQRPRDTTVSAIRAVKYCSILTQAERNVETVGEVVEDLITTIRLRKR